MFPIIEFNNLHSTHNHGGILIEFAFSIPILIILLLFACDHYRYYELKDKIKASVYLAASMVQQLGNTRTNKQLTPEDFGRITFASGMNFFHGNTMFDPWPLGIYYVVDCFWVKRINNNNYQFQECAGSSARDGIPPAKMGRCYAVSTIDLATVKSMHPDLECNKDGEERVLVECTYKRKYKAAFNKSQLGFFILNPQTTTSVDGSDYSREKINESFQCNNNVTIKYFIIFLTSSC